MKLIPLTRDLFAKVDDSDFKRVSVCTWQALKSRDGFYAKDNGNTYMHRLIVGAPTGMDVDHINHDTLDNRKSNLRVCSHSENLRNRTGPNRNSKSGTRGVCWYKRDSKWHAQIKVGYRRIHLGYFSNIEDARRAYAKASAEHHGAFAGTI